MKHLSSIAIAVTCALAAHLSAAGDPAAIRGDYVEVRTAEVYTGGCILGNEWDTLGREAIMAWRVASGAVNGVKLDGLSVVAVVAADRHLGSEQLGGGAPEVVKTVVMVDARATAAQRAALVTMTRRLAPAMTRDIVQVRNVPIAFARAGTEVSVAAGDARLDVTTRFEHSPACGAMKWFDPLSAVTGSELGLARTNSWSGAQPGAQWSQTERKSSFVGSFTYSH